MAAIRYADDAFAAMGRSCRNLSAVFASRDE